MSESNVHYFKLLEKKHDVEEDIFKKLGDLQDLKKKIAEQMKKKARDNREREEHLLKKIDFEQQGLIDKAFKSEVATKKKEAHIAEKEYKIREFERRIKKVEVEIDKLEQELNEVEGDISAHQSGQPSQPKESFPLEPTVLEDD